MLPRTLLRRLEIRMDGSRAPSSTLCKMPFRKGGMQSTGAKKLRALKPACFANVCRDVTSVVADSGELLQYLLSVTMEYCYDAPMIRLKSANHDDHGDALFACIA